MNEAVYIEVRAGVRYWEDATVNGKEDRAGDLIPLRKGDSWCPVIRLADGVVMDWPAGTTADVSYKVCDDGEYWLLDADRKRIAKWADYYVPGAVLCQDGGGYGDYIIVVVGPDGTIRGWNKPSLNPSQWNKL
jgi:WD40 repeat protein